MFVVAKHETVLSAADSSYVGVKGTVIGWGRLGERKKSSNILQKVDVPIISNEDCKEMGYAPEKITDNMICAGYKEGQQDACQVRVTNKTPGCVRNESKKKNTILKPTELRPKSYDYLSECYTKTAYTNQILTF